MPVTETDQDLCCVVYILITPNPLADQDLCCAVYILITPYPLAALGLYADVIWRHFPIT